jgi:hypothetical protein
MTPKEKAEELVRKYYTFGLNNPSQSFSWYECKQCALIAVDEVLDELLEIVTVTSSKYISKHINYYQEIKHELTKQQEQ